MPKFEVNTYNGDETEIMVTPAEGDLRFKDFGTIEKRSMNGVWEFLCDINKIETFVNSAEGWVSKLESWMWEEQEKDKAIIIANELEEKFDDLQEAGRYLREMEKQLRVARAMYEGMTKECREKLKTFERLDTPYPGKIEMKERV